MNDTWKTGKQWKQERINKTLTPMTQKIGQLDSEIIAAHIHMAKVMVEGGSYEALTRWMKSQDQDAVDFRNFVNERGFRAVISQLYKNLASANVNDLKRLINER